MFRLRSLLSASFALLALRAPLAGQAADSAARPAPLFARLVQLGGAEEDRLRLKQLGGAAAADRFLIRSLSTLLPETAGGTGGPRVQLLAPALREVWNSRLPFSLNQANLWAGRGLAGELTGGARVAWGPLHLVLAPEIAVQQNLSFQVPEYPFRDRSVFASVWHATPQSADLPLRFGRESFTTFGLGQSALEARVGPVGVGVSTESQWWGPGARNAIVMSNNAPGFPHAFARTATPVRTAVGSWDARWILGGLTESLFFDNDRGNDVRSLSGLVLTFTPAPNPWVSVGLARTVYAPTSGAADVASHALDVFTRSGRPRMRPDSSWVPGPDQLTSLFGRWVFPRDGAEVYAEWARRELPRSVRDWLVAPNHTQGYTLGAAWAREVVGDQRLRLHTEFTNLEQSSTFRNRRADTYYVSRSVVQGYTNRGRVIGAAIGPGASSQWFAADWFAPRWRLGLFANRIRWENDAYYHQATGFAFLAHDVSFVGGVRASIDAPFGAVDLQWTAGKRYNYLFQNESETFYAERAIDVPNHTLELTLSPGWHRD